MTKLPLLIPMAVLAAANTASATTYKLGPWQIQHVSDQFESEDSLVAISHSGPKKGGTSIFVECIKGTGFAIMLVGPKGPAHASFPILFKIDKAPVVTLSGRDEAGGGVTFVDQATRLERLLATSRKVGVRMKFGTEKRDAWFNFDDMQKGKDLLFKICPPASN